MNLVLSTLSHTHASRISDEDLGGVGFLRFHRNRVKANGVSMKGEAVLNVKYFWLALAGEHITLYLCRTESCFPAARGSSYLAPGRCLPENEIYEYH